MKRKCVSWPPSLMVKVNFSLASLLTILWIWDVYFSQCLTKSYFSPLNHVCCVLLQKVMISPTSKNVLWCHLALKGLLEMCCLYLLFVSFPCHVDQHLYFTSRVNNVLNIKSKHNFAIFALTFRFPLSICSPMIVISLPLQIKSQRFFSKS